MTIGADARRGSLTREELLPVAIDTRCMLRKLSDVGESSIAFAHLFPVRSGKFVARITGELLVRYVSDVRKLRVVGTGLRPGSCRAPAGLRVCLRHRK